MRRFKATVLILVFGGLITTLLQPTTAIAHHQEGPCTGFRTTARDVTEQVRRYVASERSQDLAYCLWRVMDPPVSWSRILGLVERESGWIPWTINWSGCGGYDCLGLLQHHRRYWPARADALPRSWFPHTYPNVGGVNARANLIAGFRMMKAQGGLCPAWC